MTTPDGGIDIVDPLDGLVGSPDPSETATPGHAAVIPAYLHEVYGWAYLNRINANLLDHDAVVSAILLGNNSRLRRTLLAEIEPGQRVLHVAHVYGRLIPELAARVGCSGRLDVIDLVPLQVELCRRKLRAFPQAEVRIADASHPGDGVYDAITCFFLLHEIPDERKRSVVDALLARIVLGGRVVFVDYHKPHWAHPLKAVTSLVFDTLEPFAKDLWRQEIKEFASNPGPNDWRKQTYFGGLFQKVVARRAVGSTAPQRRTRREFDEEPWEGG